MTPAQLKKQKSLLRQKLRQKLKGLKRSSQTKKNLKITKKVIASSLFKRAENILAYMALPGEASTRKILRQALKLKKKVYLPKVDPKRKTMQAFQVLSLQKDLKKGSFGILEPRALKSRKVSPRIFDLVLVPGLGFDRKGRRLGRGAGYFDRYLKKAKKAKKLGIGFREQKIARVPVSSQDVSMDQVITD